LFVVNKMSRCQELTGTMSRLVIGCLLWIKCHGVKN